VASVSFRGVLKRFAGDVVAVKDLSIEVADKEFLILVGPSGCGKSTTLRMLAGLEEITEGEIYIGDRLVNNVAPKDRDIAMVFQSYALYPHMTVYDNMAFGLRLRKTPKQVIDQRVREVAKSLGIEQLLDRKPRQLSGGQRQRVAVGRAIVREPAVFLLDEPLSNLDAKLRVETRAFISKLHQRLGTTFIYVTHDQTEAMTMGTRIAVMSAGELQQIDTPQTLYDHPNNVFVAGFIGSPSMNFFDNSKLVETDGKMFVDTGLFRVAVPDSRREELRPSAGRELILGMRPEHLHDPQFLSPGLVPSRIEANVDVVELMGNEKLVYLEEGGKTFIARMDPRSAVSVGQRIQIDVDINNIRLFDKTTEKALWRVNEASA
jgi:multiple sugar transport system ATP-binding protein